ncbi:MAG TPA: dihydrofolate reductase [Hyphomicrobium sp.]|nr:dihydrofolate reductase [Hyphomicrobium sp.]
MLITLVVAVADNGVIGRNGGLPWRLSSDLKAFRRLTMGKPLIMGRRTFQSLKRPLDGRDNIVVSRDANFRHDGAVVMPSFPAALAEGERCALSRGVDEVMVIGGADIFAEALPLAGRIYKTEVHGSPEGDTLMPDVDWARWREVFREKLPRAERDDYDATLILFERKPRA